MISILTGAVIPDKSFLSNLTISAGLNFGLTLSKGNAMLSASLSDFLAVLPPSGPNLNVSELFISPAIWVFFEDSSAEYCLPPLNALGNLSNPYK